MFLVLSSNVPTIFSQTMADTQAGSAMIDIEKEQEEIDKLIETLLEYNPEKRRNSALHLNSPDNRSSPSNLRTSNRGRGRPPKIKSTVSAPTSVDDSPASFGALVECIKKLGNHNKILLNKVKELDLMVSNLRHDVGEIKESDIKTSVSVCAGDSHQVASSCLSAVVDRVDKLEDNINSRLLLCRGPAVESIITSCTVGGVLDLERVKAELCTRICGSEITRISVGAVGVNIFGRNRNILKLECITLSVKRHLLQQVKRWKPRGVYVVEYLSKDKLLTHRSLINLKKKYPTVIKAVYIRSSVIYGKIGEGVLKFESTRDVEAINQSLPRLTTPCALDGDPPAGASATGHLPPSSCSVLVRAVGASVEPSCPEASSPAVSTSIGGESSASTSADTSASPSS